MIEIPAWLDWAFAIASSFSFVYWMDGRSTIADLSRQNGLLARRLASAEAQLEREREHGHPALSRDQISSRLAAAAAHLDAQHLDAGLTT